MFIEYRYHDRIYSSDGNNAYNGDTQTYIVIDTDFADAVKVEVDDLIRLEHAIVAGSSSSVLALEGSIAVIKCYSQRQLNVSFAFAKSVKYSLNHWGRQDLIPVLTKICAVHYPQYLPFIEESKFLIDVIDDYQPDEIDRIKRLKSFV